MSVLSARRQLEVDNIWEEIHLVVGELVIPQSHTKCKFVIIKDAASRFMMVVPLYIYGITESRQETGDDIVSALAQCLSLFQGRGVWFPTTHTPSSASRSRTLWRAREWV